MLKAEWGWREGGGQWRWPDLLNCKVTVAIGTADSSSRVVLGRGCGDSLH